jgi:hypothetical protein
MSDTQDLFYKGVIENPDTVSLLFDNLYLSRTVEKDVIDAED